MPKVISATYTVRAVYSLNTPLSAQQKDWILKLNCGHTVERLCVQEPKTTKCEYCKQEVEKGERMATSSEIPAPMLNAATAAVLRARQLDPDGTLQQNKDNARRDAQAALTSAGITDLLARIAELEAAQAELCATIEAHDVRLESCDRDGNEFCDCLERAIKKLSTTRAAQSGGGEEI